MLFRDSGIMPHPTVMLSSPGRPPLRSGGSHLVAVFAEGAPERRQPFGRISGHIDGGGSDAAEGAPQLAAHRLPVRVAEPLRQPAVLLAVPQTLRRREQVAAGLAHVRTGPLLAESATASLTGLYRQRNDSHRVMAITSTVKENRLYPGSPKKAQSTDGSSMVSSEPNPRMPSLPVPLRLSDGRPWSRDHL